MLYEMRKRSIPVVIGSDAHEPERVGDRFLQALKLVEDSGYDRVSYFLNRKRYDVATSDARASLQVD
jgi:histidinol-phosphatase (PHP family)